MESVDLLGSQQSPSMHHMSDQKLHRSNIKQNKSPVNKIVRTEVPPTDRDVKMTEMGPQINRDSVYYATGDRTIKVSTQTLDNLLMDDKSDADEMMAVGPTEAPRQGEEDLKERRNSQPKSKLPNLIGPSSPGKASG